MQIFSKPFGDFIHLLLFRSLWFIPSFLFGQILVQDTLIIRFPSPESDVSFFIAIDSVADKREYPPYIIGIHEKKEYQLVPVDLMIQTEERLSHTLKKSLPVSSHTNSLKYSLEIEDFWLSLSRNTFFSPRYQLNSAFGLYARRQEGEKRIIGHLVYEVSSPRSFFETDLRKGYRAVINKWHNLFLQDLARVSPNGESERLRALTNFRPGHFIGKRMYFHGEADFLIWQRNQIIDANLYFSRREANKGFFRKGKCLRFRHEKDLLSIEFSLINDYYIYRFHPSFVFRGKSQLFFGLNSWKNVGSVGHHILDAVILDYSLSQGLFYDPMNKQSVVFGIGFFESVQYIYSKDSLFQFGLLFSLGFKI